TLWRLSPNRPAASPPTGPGESSTSNPKPCTSGRRCSSAAGRKSNECSRFERRNLLVRRRVGRTARSGAGEGLLQLVPLRREIAEVAQHDCDVRYRSLSLRGRAGGLLHRFHQAVPFCDHFINRTGRLVQVRYHPAAVTDHLLQLTIQRGNIRIGHFYVL